MEPKCSMLRNKELGGKEPWQPSLQDVPSVDTSHPYHLITTIKTEPADTSFEPSDFDHAAGESMKRENDCETKDPFFVAVKEEVFDDEGSCERDIKYIFQPPTYIEETSAGLSGCSSSVDTASTEKRSVTERLNLNSFLMELPPENSCRRKKYLCPFCAKVFRKKRQFMDHMLCHKRQTASYRNEALTNERMNSRKLPFSCRCCEKTFERQAMLRQHICLQTEKGPFFCDMCAKIFTQREVFAKHMSSHSGDCPFVCSICGKAFEKRLSLNSHLNVHSHASAFKCDACGKSFKCSLYLKRHLRIHAGVRHYKCSVCPKSFTTSISLKTHILKHSSESKYCCVICEKTFIKKNDLKTHTAAIHS